MFGLAASRETAPSPEDFAKTPREVIDNFTRHLGALSISEEVTIEILSIPRFWDRELFELLIEQFKTGYPPTALPRLCRFSFVQEGQVPESWALHALMREGLAERMDRTLFQQVHQFLFDYYNLC